jgi:uncharacterized Zn-finger protein
VEYFETIKCEDGVIVESIDENYISEEEITAAEDYNIPESSDDDQSYINDPENEERALPYQCNECSKTFAKKSHLASHQTSHENLRLFKCHREGCNSAFNVCTRLVRHLRNVHQANEEEITDIRERSKDMRQKKIKNPKEKVPKGKVQCEICLKVLSNTRYLKEHMTMQHLKNSKYVCNRPGCKKRFKIWSLLERHLRKHDGQRE